MIYFAIVVMILFFAMILEKFQNIDLKILYYIIFIFVLVFFTGLRGDIEPDYIFLIILIIIQMLMLIYVFFILID